MKPLAALSVLAAISACHAGSQKHPKPPPVLHGTVSSVDGNIFVLSAQGVGPNGRQVDLSSAVFEGLDGKPVPRFQLRANDVVIVVVDPEAPTEFRPKPQPGHPMPMFIRLLPLKAMVVERLTHAPDPTSIKP